LGASSRRSSLRGGEFLGYEGMVELARQALAAPTLREMGQAILAGALASGDGSLCDDACFWHDGVSPALFHTFDREDLFLFRDPWDLLHLHRYSL
jgi:hypothetical protein